MVCPYVSFRMSCHSYIITVLAAVQLALFEEHGDREDKLKENVGSPREYRKYISPLCEYVVSQVFLTSCLKAYTARRDTDMCAKDKY